MATYNVSNQTQLKAAIAAARAGDVILLAEGDYAEIRLKNRTFAEAVTFASADADRPARVAKVNVINSDNVTFKNMDVGYKLAAGEKLFAQMATVSDSSGITFDSIHFHGSLDGNPGNDGNGLGVRDSSNIRLLNSVFEQLGRGVMFGGSTDIEVLNNHFHDLRSDGADFSQVQRARILGNRFHDFFPVGADHPDAIQFFSTGAKESSRDILIADNQIMQGNGRGIQGIFLRNASGELPYERVVISNNLVYNNDAINGITIQSGRDAVVQNNTVLSRQSDRYTHWIRMENIDGLVLKDNVADAIINDRNSNVSLINNVRLDQAPGRAAEIRDLNAGAAATAEGLTMRHGGYRPQGAPAPLSSPQIDDDADAAQFGAILKNVESGHLRLNGGAAEDTITGGAGNDVIYGGGGADRLTGGAGSDSFRYAGAAESTGLACDQLIGFDCRADKIDLIGDVKGLSDIVRNGRLSGGNFDDDLAGALDGLLGVGEAALFAANSGNIAGRLFIVVDANGKAGYQSGQDYVVELVDPLVQVNPAIDFFV